MLIDSLHRLVFISKIDPLYWLILYLDRRWIDWFRSEGSIVCSHHRNLMIPKHYRIISTYISNLSCVLSFFLCILISIGRFIVREILLFEIVVVSSHLVLALLLSLGSFSCNLFTIIVDFISCTYLIGIVRTKLEVMSFQFMQFIIIKFGFLHILPCTI